MPWVGGVFDPDVFDPNVFDCGTLTTSGQTVLMSGGLADGITIMGGSL